MWADYQVTFYFKYADPITRTVRASSTFAALDKAGAVFRRIGVKPMVTIVKPAQ